jgi:hypothetical protein
MTISIFEFQYILSEYAFIWIVCLDEDEELKNYQNLIYACQVIPPWKTISTWPIFSIFWFAKTISISIKVQYQ